jgi:hypothetical protein
MSKIGEQNPDWLTLAIVQDTLDWNKAAETTFPILLNHVNLHDSYWQGLYMTEACDVVISIQLDAFWNKEYTEKVGTTDFWPYLIIRIPHTINIFTSAARLEHGIGWASSTAVPFEEIERLIEGMSESGFWPSQLYQSVLDTASQLCRSRIEDCNEGYVEILHSEKIHLLLINQDGTYLNASPEKAPFIRKADSD